MLGARLANKPQTPGLFAAFRVAGCEMISASARPDPTRCSPKQPAIAADPLGPENTIFRSRVACSFHH